MISSVPCPWSTAARCVTKPTTRGCSAHECPLPPARTLAAWHFACGHRGGPVGSGKTALTDARVQAARPLRPRGPHQRHLQRGCAQFLTRSGALARSASSASRQAAARARAPRDASINLAAVADLAARFPDLDLVIIESGGDNLAATFSPELADLAIYVIDVSAGDKIPRKGGQASRVPIHSSSRRSVSPLPWAPRWRRWIAMPAGCAASGPSSSATSRGATARARLPDSSRGRADPSGTRVVFTRGWQRVMPTTSEGIRVYFYTSLRACRDASLRSPCSLRTMSGASHQPDDRIGIQTSRNQRAKCSMPSSIEVSGRKPVARVKSSISA